MELIKKTNKEIVKVVMGNVAVKRLIGLRFYPAYLATVKSPTFPCANFTITVSDASVGGDVIDGLMSLWGHSKRSFDNALDVYEAIRNVLKGSPIRTSYLSLVLKEITAGLTQFDEISRVYTVMGKWDFKSFKR